MHVYMYMYVYTYESIRVIMFPLQSQNRDAHSFCTNTAWVTNRPITQNLTRAHTCACIYMCVNNDGDTCMQWFCVKGQDLFSRAREGIRIYLMGRGVYEER